MPDQDEGMYADGYEDFSDDSGSIPHACTQPYADLTVCRAQCLVLLLKGLPASALRRQYPSAPCVAGSMPYKCIWCCWHSVRMFSVASHLFTPQSNLSYVVVDTSFTA